MGERSIEINNVKMSQQTTCRLLCNKFGNLYKMDDVPR